MSVRFFQRDGKWHWVAFGLVSRGYAEKQHAESGFKMVCWWRKRKGLPELRQPWT